MIADEIQSGLGRSGKLLACDWEDVRPDVVVRTFTYMAHLFPFCFLVAFVLDTVYLFICMRACSSSGIY